jgi:hypothetical protein
LAETEAKHAQVTLQLDVIYEGIARIEGDKLISFEAPPAAGSSKWRVKLLPRFTNIEQVSIRQHMSAYVSKR